MCNIKSLSLLVQKLWSRLRSRSRGKEFWFQQEGLARRNTHVKYKSPISCGSKVVAKVKFFKSRSKVKVKVTMSNFLVQTESSCHKEPTCVI